MRSVIERSLILAFDKLQDLAVPAVLSKKQGVSFDFGANAVVTDPTEFVSINLVVLEHKKIGSTVNEKVLFRKVSSISNYDTIVYNDIQWSVGSTILDGDFVTILQLYRSINE